MVENHEKNNEENGTEGLKINERIDRKRVRKSLCSIEKKEERRMRKIRKIHEEEEKIAAEGESYGAGIAPLKYKKKKIK